MAPPTRRLRVHAAPKIKLTALRRTADDVSTLVQQVNNFLLFGRSAGQ